MLRPREKLLLLLFLGLHLAYSFWQFTHFALEGDFVEIVLPAANCVQVLHDPLGLHALLGHETYTAPNRFFAHIIMHEYFHAAPVFLQRWFGGIDSLYLACAVLKLVAQALFIYMLGVFIGGSFSVWNSRWLVGAALVTPLFQTTGFSDQMGLIDHSITYAVCYGLFMGPLLLFFQPVFRAFMDGQPIRIPLWGNALLAALALALALGGSIISGVALLVCPAGLLWAWWQRWQAQPAGGSALQRAWRAVWQIPGSQLFLYLFFSLISLYSLYLGFSNAENFGEQQVALADRFSLLPWGVWDQVRRKPGLPVLLGFVLLNTYLLRRLPRTAESRRILLVLNWLGIFSLAYIVLLPFGGYRPYRPFMLRRDSIIPILTGLVLTFGLSSAYLLRHLGGRARPRYLAGLLAVLAMYLGVNLPVTHDNNTCERAMLARIISSPTTPVVLPMECTVLSWQPITTVAASENAAKLLQQLGLTKQVKLYRQEPQAQ